MKRCLLELGYYVQVEGECKDGEELRMKVPSRAQVDELVAKNHRIETAERGSSLTLP
jgi:hypothetical protein